jgi:hypothetical protein
VCLRSSSSSDCSESSLFTAEPAAAGPAVTVPPPEVCPITTAVVTGKTCEPADTDWCSGRAGPAPPPTSNADSAAAAAASAGGVCTGCSTAEACSSAGEAGGGPFDGDGTPDLRLRRFDIAPHGRVETIIEKRWQHRKRPTGVERSALRTAGRSLVTPIAAPRDSMYRSSQKYKL